MLKKLTMLLLVFALIFHAAVPAFASEYSVTREGVEAEEGTDPGTTDPDPTVPTEPYPTIPTEPEEGPPIDWPIDIPDLAPEMPEESPNLGNPEEGEIQFRGSDEGDAINLDDEGDEGDDTDWHELFLALQTESSETFEYVNEHFETLHVYLLENHISNARALEVYFILYGEFLDLYFEENLGIQLDVIAGELTHEEGVRLLRANIAAMRAMVPRVQNFNPANPGASITDNDGSGGSGYSNGSSNGGPGGIDGGNGGNGRFRLPQTGATIVSFALAGVALLGSGTTAILFKKRKYLDEQFDLGDLL